MKKIFLKGLIFLLIIGLIQTSVVFAVDEEKLPLADEWNLVRPVEGPITSKFDLERRHPVDKVVKPHRGVDIYAPEGTPVVAAADGKIIFVGKDREDPDTGELLGYGNYIKIQHKDSLGKYGPVTHYGHLKDFFPGFKKEFEAKEERDEVIYVKAGQPIGYVCSTGTATKPHLDFGVRSSESKYTAVDPEKSFGENLERMANPNPREIKLYEKKAKIEQKMPKIEEKITKQQEIVNKQSIWQKITNWFKELFGQDTPQKELKRLTKDKNESKTELVTLQKELESIVAQRRKEQEQKKKEEEKRKKEDKAKKDKDLTPDEYLAKYGTHPKGYRCVRKGERHPPTDGTYQKATKMLEEAKRKFDEGLIGVGELIRIQQEATLLYHYQKDQCIKIKTSTPPTGSAIGDTSIQSIADTPEDQIIDRQETRTYSPLPDFSGLVPLMRGEKELSSIEHEKYYGTGRREVPGKTYEEAIKILEEGKRLTITGSSDSIEEAVKKLEEGTLKYHQDAPAP